MYMQGKSNKKDMNFDLNIVSFIDVMSVLITFLLMATVWAHLGVMNVDQATGDTNHKQSVNPPTVWAEMKVGGDMLLTFKDLKSGTMKPIVIRGRDQKPDWEVIEYYIQSVQQKIPEIKTAVILPNKQTEYGDVIQIMDRMKKHLIQDVGVSPL
jgi:biopolymer transport protein TolR